MITKAHLIDGALQHLSVEGLLLQPMAADQSSALQHADDLAAMYAAKGLDTGYILPEQYGTSTGADDSGIDVGLAGAFKVMLAGYIANQYGKELNPNKLAFAEKALFDQLVTVEGAKYPVTLPIGSGNYDWADDQQFYRGGLPIGN